MSGAQQRERGTLRSLVAFVKNLLAPKDYRSRLNRYGFFLFAPSLLFLLVFVLIPVLYITYLSLHEVSLLGRPEAFVGLEHYIGSLTDQRFRMAFWRDIIYAFGAVSFQVIVGVSFALVINREFFGSSLARTFTLLPYLVPLIGVVLMWQWIMNPVYGVLSHYLVAWGITDSAVQFFDADIAMASVIFVGGWKYMAFVALVILARLQAIDEILYEQARVSGASAVQMFRYITLPNLRSALLLVILLRSVWNFNHFANIWLLTRGGPLSVTQTLPIHLYQITFQRFQLGRGSAIAMILFFILTLAAIVYFYVFEPSEEIETTR